MPFSVISEFALLRDLRKRKQLILRSTRTTERKQLILRSTRTTEMFCKM